MRLSWTKVYITVQTFMLFLSGIEIEDFISKTRLLFKK